MMTERDQLTMVPPLRHRSSDLGSRLELLVNHDSIHQLNKARLQLHHSGWKNMGAFVPFSIPVFHSCNPNFWTKILEFRPIF